MKVMYFICFLILLLSACATQNKHLYQQKYETSSAPKIQYSWSVSGISSGAMMSAQLGIIHSKQITGIGIFSGSIYGCSHGDVQTALKTCMAAPEKINANSSFEYIKQKAANNMIDPIGNMTKQNIFIVHGEKDQMVKVAASTKNQELYRKLKTKTSVKTIANLGHGIATANKGSACDVTASPWLNNCSYNTMNELFNILFPTANNYKSEIPAVSTELIKNNMSVYDLTLLTTKENLAAATFSESLYIYTPSACKKESCPRHLALHGCHQSPEFVNKEFIENAGYIEAAEKFKVVVLFPSVYKSTKNPYGCWDWWGYTDNKFDTKDGAQIKILNTIMAWL
jgi:poly(3-hydroxybutyrate) depolymerase